MLHKPPGCVSATRDPEHPTVLDLIQEPDKEELHIAGRLDFNTTGLMLITNDGSWSRRLTQPQTKLPKVYYVETEQDIGPEYALKFTEGLYFAFEDLTTLPAELDGARAQVRAPEHRRRSLSPGEADVRPLRQQSAAPASRTHGPAGARQRAKTGRIPPA